MIFTTAILADVHFGAVSSKQLYQELKDQFLEFIKDRYLDMIVIAGDFFNSVISLNSKTSMRAFRFMDELVGLCKRNNIRYIRIIEGTLSHDNFQIENFSVFESDPDLDFRVITKICDEVLDGLRILYVPEEYIENPMEYYKPYFDRGKKYYNMIFGHGMFKETSFTNDDGENIISQAPILDSKVIGTICRGPVFFGHIHTSQVIRKHIYYVGSFSRWVYGQEEPKGFYVSVYDTDTDRYAVEFIENTMARRYDTLKVHLDYYDKPIESLINVAKTLKVDNLRIQVLIEGSEKDFSAMLAMLKEYYTGKAGYKLDIVDKREKLRQEKTEEKVNKILTEYNFVFDNSIPVDVKIHKFIKRKHSKDVSDEIIRNVLNLDTNKHT